MEIFTEVLYGIKSEYYNGFLIIGYIWLICLHLFAENPLFYGDIFLFFDVHFNIIRLLNTKLNYKYLSD